MASHRVVPRARGLAEEAFAVRHPPARPDRPAAASSDPGKPGPGRPGSGSADPQPDPSREHARERAARADQDATSPAFGRDWLRSADGGDPDRTDRWSRAVSDRRELCPPSRHRANQMLLRPAPTAPTQPRRRPPAQPRAAHHRDHPRPSRPDHPRVPRTQTSRRQNQERRAALPQAPPRPPVLAATRRAAAPSRPGHHTRAGSRAGRTPGAHHPRTPRPTPRGRPHDHRADPDGLHHLTASSPNQNPIYSPLPADDSRRTAQPTPQTKRSRPMPTSPTPNDAFSAPLPPSTSPPRPIAPPKRAPSHRPSPITPALGNPHIADLP